MASGKLGSADLAAAVDTVVYTVPALKVSTVNVRFANRNATPARVRVAITGGGAPVAADYVTYESAVPGYGVLEDIGLVMAAGEKLYCRSEFGNMSVRAHGFEE